MNTKSILGSKIVLLGLVFSILITISHYFILEKSIHDYRLTFSTESSNYDAIKPSLTDYRNSTQEVDFFISPNFDAIADTLQESGLRRFELKLSTSEDIDVHRCYNIYFVTKLNTKHPEFIRMIQFADSRPFQKSLGYGILTLCCFLLLDTFSIRKRQNE